MNEDRWDIHFVVKSLDIRYTMLVPLLAKMGVEVYRDDRGCEWISKAEFRAYLNESVR